MQKQYFSTVLEMVKALNALLVIGFVLLGITCSILSIALYQSMKHQKTTFLPPEIKEPFQISQVTPDKPYLSQMGLYLLNLKYNVTPESVKASHEMLLGYIHPENYSALLNRLNQEEKAIREQKIASVFYPDSKSIAVSVDTLQMKVTGTLKKWVGTRALAPQTMTLVLDFDYRQGLLWLKNIGTVKKEGRENP